MSQPTLVVFSSVSLSLGPLRAAGWSLQGETEFFLPSNNFIQNWRKRIPSPAQRFFLLEVDWVSINSSATQTNHVNSMFIFHCRPAFENPTVSACCAQHWLPWKCFAKIVVFFVNKISVVVKMVVVDKSCNAKWIAYSTDMTFHTS